MDVHAEVPDRVPTPLVRFSRRHVVVPVTDVDLDGYVERRTRLVNIRLRDLVVGADGRKQQLDELVIGQQHIAGPGQTPDLVDQVFVAELVDLTVLDQVWGPASR